MAAHRYWRVRIWTARATNYTSLAEIELRESIGGPDVTGSGTAISSTVYQTYYPSLAFDNNNTTYWWGFWWYTADWYVGYDFGAGNAKDIKEIALMRRAGTTGANEQPKWFEVQWSDDSLDWLPILEVNDATLWTEGVFQVYEMEGNARRVSTAGLMPVTQGTTRRVSTAGLLAIGSSGTRRVSTAGLLVYTGMSTRRISTAGLFAVCPAPMPPAPGIAALTYFANGAVTITTEAYGGSTPHGATWYRIRHPDDGVVWQERVVDPSYLISYRIPDSTLAWDTAYWVDAMHEDVLNVVSGWGEYGDFVTPPEPPEPLPPEPVISAVVAGPSAIRVTVVKPGDNATDHDLYVAESSTGLIDPANLYAGGLGPLPDAVDVTGRELGHTYYCQVRATTPTGDLDSNIAKVTLVEPSLSVNSITDTRGNLRVSDAYGAYAVQYQTTLGADTEFATPFDDLIDTGVDRFNRYLTDLTEDTPYRSRAQLQWVEGGAWSGWLDVVAWRTRQHVEPNPSAYFSTPAYGEPITGIYCAELVIEDPERSIATIEISADFGVSWIVLESLCIDTAQFDSGFYLLKVTLDNGEIVRHAGFVINKGSAIDYRWEPDPCTVTYQKYWHPDVPLYQCGWISCLTGMVGHLRSNPVASFGYPTGEYPAPPDAVCNRQIVIGEGSIYTSGGGFRWDQLWPCDGADVGVAAFVTEINGEEYGIVCYATHWLVGHAYQPVETAGVNPGSFRVGIGPVNDSVWASWGAWHEWVVDIPITPSWTTLRTAYPGSGGDQYWPCSDYPRIAYRPYKFYLDVSRPSPGVPNRLRIYARCDSYDPWAPGHRRISEIGPLTVDVVRRINQYGFPDPPFTMPCGPGAGFTSKAWGAGTELRSGIFIKGFGVWQPPVGEVPVPGEVCPFDVCEPVADTTFGACEPTSTTGFDKCHTTAETTFEVCEPPPDICIVTRNLLS